MSFLLHCSFCGKFHAETAKLVVGATAAICTECIILCAEIAEIEVVTPVCAEPVCAEPVCAESEADAR